MADFTQMQAFVLQKLADGLPERLFYHSMAHTRDVLDAAVRIGTAENITAQEMVLLKSAALLHDVGFLDQYFDNEACACEQTRAWLPQFGYPEFEIDMICEMIMATRIPQTPQTQLEKILCDADLDYLGRPDFYDIGGKLFREFMEHKVVDCETSWNQLQVRFLQSHVYFTDSSRKLRSPLKKAHLKQLQTMLNVYQ